MRDEWLRKERTSRPGVVHSVDEEVKSRKDIPRSVSRKPSTHQGGSGCSSDTMGSSCTVNLSPLFLLVVVIRKVIASVANRRGRRRTKGEENRRHGAALYAHVRGGSFVVRGPYDEQARLVGVIRRGKRPTAGSWALEWSSIPRLRFCSAIVITQTMLP